MTLVSRQTVEKTGIVNGTVTRSGPTTGELRVTLSLSNGAAASFSSDREKPQVQTVVVIPRGSASATFTVFALDNTIPDDIQNTTILATATGFQNGAATLRVNDDEDSAILTITVRSNFPFNDPAIPDASEGPSFLETVGPLAATATITRNTATTSDVVVALESGSTGIARVPLVAVIPTGSTSATFYISAVDDEICEDDPEFTVVRGRVAGFADGVASVRAVNDEVCFGRALTVELTSNNIRVPGKVVESDGPRAGNVRVTRFDELVADYSLVVDLTSSVPNRGGAAPLSLTTPTRVIIPAGRTFIDVPLSLLDNQDTEGCLTIGVAPSPVGFINTRLPASRQVLIPINQVGTRVAFEVDNNNLELLDNETPIASLTVRPSTFNESGSAGVATGMITRTGPLTEALEVTITSTDTSEVSVSETRLAPNEPLKVTIRPGERSASFAVVAVDDNLVDGDQKASLQATTVCYTPITSAELTVRDDDLPSIRFEGESPISVQEGRVFLVPLVRNSTTNSPLTVSLQSTDNSEVTVPRTVTIPAKSDRVLVPITAVQDRLIDGDQRVRITASATGFRAVGIDVNVVDVPVPTFTLAATPSTLSEGATARVTLTRNLLVNTAMTVPITSSNPSRLRVPSSVTLPAGSASTTFAVVALNDTLDNGNAVVTLTASKNGIVSGSTTVTVLDNDPALLAGQSTLGAKLSSVSAHNDVVTLTFIQALDANAASDVANFAIEVGAAPIAIDGATYNAATRSVVLQLATGAIDAGESVNVRWKNLTDATGVDAAGTTTITSR